MRHLVKSNKTGSGKAQAAKQGKPSGHAAKARQEAKLRELGHVANVGKAAKIPATWNPYRQCHDCAGPCYRNTIRCAYHGLRHAWKAKGYNLGPSQTQAMWSSVKSHTVLPPLNTKEFTWYTVPRVKIVP